MSPIIQLAGLICIVLAVLIFVAVIIAGGIRARWKRQPAPVPEPARWAPPIPRKPEMLVSKRTFLDHKEPAMATNPLQNSLPPDGPDRLGNMAVPGDALSSVNDQHRFRGQDQAINRIALQLSDMERLPWKIEEESLSGPFFLSVDNAGQPVTGLVKLARAVSAMCNPIAVAGSTPNNASYGSTEYVSVGTSRVPASSSAEARALCLAMNQLTFKALDPIRETLLATIAKWATNRKVATAIVQEDWMHFVVGSSNTCVMLPSREAAQQLCKVLNDLYLEVIAPARGRLLTELASLCGGVAKYGEELGEFKGQE